METASACIAIKFAFGREYTPQTEKMIFRLLKINPIFTSKIKVNGNFAGTIRAFFDEVPKELLKFITNISNYYHIYHTIFFSFQNPHDLISTIYDNGLFIETNNNEIERLAKAKVQFEVNTYMDKLTESFKQEFAELNKRTKLCTDKMKLLEHSEQLKEVILGKPIKQDKQKPQISAMQKKYKATIAAFNREDEAPLQHFFGNEKSK